MLTWALRSSSTSILAAPVSYSVLTFHVPAQSRFLSCTGRTDLFVVVHLSQLADEREPDCALLVDPRDERGGM